ncbi:MAG: hypothetical protein UX09_C0017G0001 [Candidatus Uhrbacteria bacterium GW2011_GWE2_45_35]|uniref:Lipoprotein n=1 Tax=Candidatus Uhrbacteria bacterium GW2011_GWE2_45_35 TaxID=1618993 RepID=A0A0G1PSJ4_9BACT|nr:MAG: hypothetical protein UX09_C0017G0001 [Candidatus Uhrbacteria bacterium GW2011_GWE2_45_35]
MTATNTMSLWAVMLLGLALLGCPTDPNDTAPEGDADTDADADGDTDADADTDSEYAIMVLAGTTAAFNLYDEDEEPAPDCVDVFGCWITVPGPDTYDVYAKKENWIFVPQTIEVTEGMKKPVVDWTALPGLEGYAPNGVYRNQDMEEKKVTTTYGDPNDYYGYEHVFLALHGMDVPNKITIDLFEGDDEEWGLTVSGAITADLTTITYHLDFGDGDPVDEILTKIR